MVQKEKPRRGRPRTFEPDAVLAEARAVFWDRGFAATSLDDLASATGLNRPSLYGAFGDKHALYLAALERSRAESLAALKRALQSEKSLREVLTAVFEGAIRIYRAGTSGQRGCFLVGTAVTQVVEDVRAREVLSSFLADTDKAFADRFAAAQASGEFRRNVEPAAAATIASGTLHTLAIRARSGASEAEMRRIAKAAVDLICD